MATASWIFCPECNRQRADGKISKDWHSSRGGNLAKRKCVGGCDKRPVELDLKPKGNGPPAVESAKSTPKAYVTPLGESLSEPVIAKLNDPFPDDSIPDKEKESDWPPQLLELTEDEVRPLTPLDIKCEF